MITNKPFLIAPEASSPDYAGRLRRALSVRGDGGASFDRALETQRAVVDTAADQRRNSVPAADRAEDAGRGDAEKKVGLPLERWERNARDARQPGPALRNTGGMALDRRSLALLQSLEHRGEARSRAVKKTTGGEAPQGRLSARYESGSRGAAAVGYDRNGGTSYGTYQISSRQGTFARFLAFLDGEEPALADRLRRAGPADTGGTRGPFPRNGRP